ncbi:MAG TPA: TIGR03619 family F420-dependent LLM class oxidoreductase [Acidimicrobiia bacterium]|nr:TIGR03619 family F420-dependent LLM class oxidoreductase [Acidimicrobiia bacterium]
MRFSYAETFCDPSYLAPLAVAAEDAGYDSFVVPDSLIFPAESDTTYPYTADGDRAFLEDKPIIEPFALIPFLAARTERIRFTTFVLKLAVRPAVLVAKQAASVAVLSNDRLRLGVGISPWPEDFAAMEVEWERRGKRMNEMVDILRGLMGGDWFEYHGEILDLARCKICPVPETPVPILIGGHADVALRRAARQGDGWIHAGGGDGTDLGAMIDRVHALRTEYGKDKDQFEIHVISMDGFSVDGVKRLEDLGVTDVIVGFRYPYTTEPDTQPLTEKVDLLTKFGDRVIAKV